MIPIITCTVSNKTTPVLASSIETYCPGVKLIINTGERTTFGEAFNKAMSAAFEEYDEIIIANDDVVLNPLSYKKLLEDVLTLKEQHGDSLGFVAAHSDSAFPVQNIRYQQGDQFVLDRHYCQWSWENEIRESEVVAPLFAWISKEAFSEAQFPPINWYSDDVICRDLRKKGFKNFISRSYVHHVGSQTVGQDFGALNAASEPWVRANRPDYARMWFGEPKTLIEQKDKKKLKICVYAISKNEEQFVARWAESAKDADLLLVADTGSTDGTVDACKANGIATYEICITPWRFDHARNASIALIPKDIDICVSLDLDEILEPGWREEIERLWNEDTTRMRYSYRWGEGIEFLYEKIHARHGYYWHHPCHEYPRPDNRITEVWANTDRLLVSHHPDNNKSRGQYLDLLELSVKEDPYCPRNAFYYARELFFYSRFQDSIDACKKYLDMPSATWIDERGYAYRIIAKSYEAIGNIVEAEAWHHRSCAEAPHIRESWMAMAQFFYNNSRWEECYAAAKRTLSIHFRAKVYTADPECWGFKPDDLAAIAAYRIGLKEEAIKHGQNALKLAPNDGRLQENLLWYNGEKE